MNICYSGGAIGADRAWGEAALKAGHDLVHFIFDEHEYRGSEHTRILTQDELLIADPHLMNANQILKRKFPTKSQNTNSLLRRNFWQIKDSDSVYAITGIDEATGIPIGGTAWAIVMFMQRYTDNDKIYIFDQFEDQWFKLNPLQIGQSVWDKISPDDVPTPTGKWTGIGTRIYFNDSAKNAIRGVFR